MSSLLSQGRIPMTPSEYAAEWSKSSSDHKRFSDYQWISTHLADPTLIFEIGCGNGNGTEALLKCGAKVVSIEINQSLLNKTADYLTECGYKVATIHLTQIDNIDMISEIQCYLIEADVFDVKIEKLFSIVKFDHILFSFFGAAPQHAAEGLGVPVEKLDSRFAQLYREKATLKAFNFKKLCGNECKLIIVDRIHKDKEFSSLQVRDFYASNLAERLDIPKKDILVETRKNQAMQRPTTSAMQYISDGSFTRRPGVPLIVIAKI